MLHLPSLSVCFDPFAASLFSPSFIFTPVLPLNPFLTQDTAALDNLFTIVESYEHMSVPYLQFSKIGKVMRHIAVLTDDKVPGDEKYSFRERAKTLIDRWHAVLNAGKPSGAEVSANGNVAAVTGKRDEETVMEGTKNLDLNAGAGVSANGNGNGGCFRFLPYGRWLLTGCALDF